MVGGYSLATSGSAMLSNLVSGLMNGIVSALPSQLPASEVSRYIFRIVLISGVLWLLFGFIFQTKEEDDK